MSDSNLISPLLDGFSMGPPMSEHNGVRCCPAIKEKSDKKYIVKIITVPPSQAQLDALLIAGAYRDPADAMDYFRRQGEDIMKEAELLKTLSALDGFLSYDGWQMEPITKRRLGYEICLVGSYKRSLEKYVRRNPVTHLEAMNLGLDLCSALSVCRQAGALYVDLKPSNIFMSAKKEYRIGDLGFVMLDAMRYTALPDKYRSLYTPPELHDPMASLNLTVDTYAVGMILYQLYNDGQLPFQGKAPDTPLPSPVNADYELAEIIMKAIHPDPAQRWDDPKDLGHALVNYMQRNAVNDVPITVHMPLDVEPDIPSTPPADEPAPEDAGPEQLAPAEAVQPVPPPQDADEATPVEEAPSDEADAAEPEQEAAPSLPAEDETLPGEEDAEALQPHEMSDELSRIMAKADDLISHETPQTVVVPQIPEIPEPTDPFAFIKEDEPEDADTLLDLPPEEPAQPEPEPKKKKKGRKGFVSDKAKKRSKKILSTLLTLLILAGIGAGAFWLYQNLYLQRIDSISIVGERNQLTVNIDTQTDNALLSVTCADNYGNVSTQQVVANQAVFTGLQPNTMYKIELHIDGFHALVGQTSEVFTTDTTTSIVTFTAVAGQEDGSVMLNFTVDGEEPEEWALICQAEGEEAQRKTFTGHSITLEDLNVGKVYTFTLDAGEDLSLSGITSLEYMVTRLILAQDLTIVSNGGSDLTIRWNSPGDIVVDSWTVRCYNADGYEEQLTVHDTEVLLTGIDSTVSYTVEVTAAGMTQPARASITANPISITAFHADTSDVSSLGIQWEFTGTAPASGWLLMYTVDGSSSENVMKCAEASATISPKLPGANYQFTIQTADAVSIFNNLQTYTCPEGPAFEGNGLTAQDITASLLKRPEEENWRFDSVGSDAVTNSFHSGEAISIGLKTDTNFYLPGTQMEALYVIRDGYGNVLPSLASQEKLIWKDIWYGGNNHYGELNLPQAPTTPGNYNVSVYFDGSLVTSLDFTITE